MRFMRAGVGVVAGASLAFVVLGTVLWPTGAGAAEFPIKGRPISIIVGAAAGGPNDVAARMLAPLLEKQLGTPVQVVNKPGAGWQVGTTQLTLSKPDGYTIGYAPIPTIITIYLDPDRKAVFNRQSFQMLATHVLDPGAIAVRADSPFKSLKELIDAAKANPGKIKASHTGIMGDDHLAILQFEKLTGTTFAVVGFDSSSSAVNALLGGHIDVDFDNVGAFLSQTKGGAVRVLGIMDKAETRYYPGVKTLEAQGVKMVSSSTRTIVMPAGAPKEVVAVLSTAIRKAMDDLDHQKKMDELGFPLKYADPEQTAVIWDEMEAQVKPFVASVKK